jgi:hypothetical protein
LADEAALYAHNPSFTDHLPWVEYLDTEQCFLLDDNRSVGAVFELLPIGTEGREPDWLMAARDALEMPCRIALTSWIKRLGWRSFSARTTTTSPPT